MVSAIGSSQRVGSLSRLGCAVAAVVVLHAAYVFVVYRLRHLTPSAFASSDFLLFGLPALLAFAAFYWLLGGRHPAWLPRWVAALFLTIISSWLSVLVPFNAYGT